MIGTVDDTFTLRVAVAADVPALNQLIAESATALSRGYYSAPQIAALVQFVFGVDTQLIRDGSYFVLERAGMAVACGGWSARATLYGGDQDKPDADPRLNPACDAARIRAFFVHPTAARQGLGRRLLSHCERQASAAGFRSAELVATLPGVPLYRALGYAPIEVMSRTLPDGTPVEFLRMGRSFDMPAT